MIDLFSFLWDNWNWLGALATGPFSFVAMRAGRTVIGWIAVAATAVLLIWAVVDGVNDYFEARDGRVAKAATDACNAGWRTKMTEAEDAARDTIRRKEAAAYQRAVEDERARAAADAEAEAEAATIVERVIKVSASARECVVDQATAEALNQLRGSGE